MDIYAGSLAGLLWALLQIIGWFQKLFKKPTLDVRLTKEAFFRLTSEGETVFTNAVLIARHGPIEIQDVHFTLKRTSGSQKVFKFSPRNVGNKVANPPDPYASNNFWSKSCKMYLAENSPTHILFLSGLEEYSVDFKTLTNKFISEVTDYRQELQGKLVDVQDKGSEYLQEIQSKLTVIETETRGNLLRLVQLESGDYELVAEVVYTRVGKANAKSKLTSTSRITFKVGTDFRDSYDLQLKSFLGIASRNILYQKSDSFLYPEYQPDQIVEA